MSNTFTGVVDHMYTYDIYNCIQVQLLLLNITLVAPKWNDRGGDLCHSTW